MSKKIEQQLKLYAESLQAKVDDFERSGKVLGSSKRVSNTPTHSQSSEKVKNTSHLFELEETVQILRERISQL